MAKKPSALVVAKHFELVAALKVLVLTPHIAAYLRTSDPKALAQATAALGLTEADVDAITVVR